MKTCYFCREASFVTVSVLLPARAAGEADRHQPVCASCHERYQRDGNLAPAPLPVDPNASADLTPGARQRYRHVAAA